MPQHETPSDTNSSRSLLSFQNMLRHSNLICQAVLYPLIPIWAHTSDRNHTPLSCFVSPHVCLDHSYVTSVVQLFARGSRELKMTPLTALPYNREGVEVLMGDLQVPAEEFSYGRSKIFIRNPRTVEHTFMHRWCSPVLWTSVDQAVCMSINRFPCAQLPCFLTVRCL